MNDDFHSDSDGDDDSRYGFSGEGDIIVVQGAGLDAVNGFYKRSGKSDGVGKYSMDAIWKGSICTFTLFRCVVSNNTKRWYISIVPNNGQPGTSQDIDFYSAPDKNIDFPADFSADIPPENQWVTVKADGVDPPPILKWKTHSNQKDEDENQKLSHSLLAESDNEAGSIVVQGAGVGAVNGVYTQSGAFDGVHKYSMEALWKGNIRAFTIFRCRLSDNTRKWYISIVPDMMQPGSNRDIDFYSAPLSMDSPNFPPQNQWTIATALIHHSLGPPPTLTRTTP